MTEELDALENRETSTEEATEETTVTDSESMEDGAQLSIALPESDEHTEETVAETETTEESDGLAASLFGSAPPYNPDKPRKIDWRFDLAELIVLTLAVVFVITSFLFSHSIVDGRSMQNTLENGDRLIISNLFYTPQRGDIVVLYDGGKILVKRVIAIGGDTVQITAAGSIYINGEKIEEDYVYIGSPNYLYDPLALTVPEGEFFYLGDHRDDSSDSRVYGTADVDAIVGKALFRFYPFDRFGSIYE